MKLRVSTDKSSGNSDEETETKVDVSGHQLMDLKNLYKCDGGESMQAY